MTFVSLVSFWEIAIKVRAGKLEAASLLRGGPAALESAGFAALGIDYRHIQQTLEPPLHHRDPFDRLLIAQAKAEALSMYPAIRCWTGVERIW